MSLRADRVHLCGHHGSRINKKIQKKVSTDRRREWWAFAKTNSLGIFGRQVWKKIGKNTRHEHTEKRELRVARPLAPQKNGIPPADTAKQWLKSARPDIFGGNSTRWQEKTLRPLGHPFHDVGDKIQHLVIICWARGRADHSRAAAPQGLQNARQQAQERGCRVFNSAVENPNSTLEKKDARPSGGCECIRRTTN